MTTPTPAAIRAVKPENAEQPASDFQLRALEFMGYTTARAQNLTKAQASAAIDEAKEQQPERWAEYQASVRALREATKAEKAAAKEPAATPAKPVSDFVQARVDASIQRYGAEGREATVGEIKRLVYLAHQAKDSDLAREAFGFMKGGISGKGARRLIAQLAGIPA